MIFHIFVVPVICCIAFCMSSVLTASKRHNEIADIELKYQHRMEQEIVKWRAKIIQEERTRIRSEFINEVEKRLAETLEKNRIDQDALKGKERESVHIVFMNKDSDKPN